MSTTSLPPTHPGDRPMVPDQLITQIGRMNILATSGGRTVNQCDDDSEVMAVVFPVAHGYRVVVTLDAADTYTVAREFVRDTKVFDKGTRTGVYADEVSEAVYWAGCYHHDFPGADVPAEAVS